MNIPALLAASAVLCPTVALAQLTDGYTAAQGMFQQNHGASGVPAVGRTQTVAPPARQAAPPPAKAEEGPAAVLAYEKSLRGIRDDRAPDPYDRYPQANTPNMERMKNIHTMDRGLWTPAQLEADLKKAAVAEQKAILVMVKTEFCHTNPWRLCTVTTAALEKRSTPLLRNFRVYGAWVKGNPDHQGPEWRKWEDELIAAYRFDQGPGAKLVAMAPGKGVLAETNALEMQLIAQELEKHGGATPTLEAWLRDALAKLK